MVFGDAGRQASSSNFPVFSSLPNTGVTGTHGLACFVWLLDTGVQILIWEHPILLPLSHLDSPICLVFIKGGRGTNANYVLLAPLCDKMSFFIIPLNFVVS